MRGLLTFFLLLGSLSPQLVVGSRSARPAVSELASGITPSRVLVEPSDGLTPLIRSLDSTQHTLFVEIYILTDTRIVRALERAAAQGVRVCVLMEEHPLGMGTQPLRMRDRLTAAGVEVRWTTQRFRLTHAKFLVLDDRLAIVSTANLSKSAFSRNREVLVFDRVRVDVRALSNLFRRDWDKTTGVDADANLVTAPENARSRITRFLVRARRSVDVYAEEVDDIAEEVQLVRASRRGIKVRLIVAGSPGPGVKRLLSCRIDVRTLSHPYVHAKVILVDKREAFTGSENLSTTSLDRNREVGVFIRGSSILRLSRVFSMDWAAAQAETGAGRCPLKLASRRHHDIGSRTTDQLWVSQQKT